jgi:hypothetical protein
MPTNASRTTSPTRAFAQSPFFMRFASRESRVARRDAADDGDASGARRDRRRNRARK